MARSRNGRVLLNLSYDLGVLVLPRDIAHEHIIQHGYLVALLDFARHDPQKRYLGHLAKAVLDCVSLDNLGIVEMIDPIKLYDEDGLLFVSDDKVERRVPEVLDFAVRQPIRGFPTEHVLKTDLRPHSVAF